MTGLRTPLSRYEEVALCKVGFGSRDSLELQHVRQLLQLDLIQWSGLSWYLTPLGRQRYDSLIHSASDHVM